jgi:hypothetical protein
LVVFCKQEFNTMKNLLILAVAALATAAFAKTSDCCGTGKACCYVGSPCCESTVVAMKQDCCGTGAACCYVGSPCCDSNLMALNQEKAEKKEACCAKEGAVAKTEGTKEACCKSTEAKVVAKGEKGCCNAKGEMAKFKVFVANEGYKFFGCEGSAKKGRAELVAAGKSVGGVQKVKSKVRVSA